MGKLKKLEIKEIKEEEIPSKTSGESKPIDENKE